MFLFLNNISGNCSCRVYTQRRVAFPDYFLWSRSDVRFEAERIQFNQLRSSSSSALIDNVQLVFCFGAGPLFLVLYANLSVFSAELV